MSERLPYVVNKLPNKTAEVLIYEPIGQSFWEEGITAKRFAEDIKALGEVRRIDVRINSPGGSMTDGLAMYNTLAAHKAQIVTHIDGVALSMASVIAMAGSTINMAKNALMMVHNPQWLAMGDAREFRKAAEILDAFKSSALVAYEKKTKRDRDDIASLMDEETWFTADEAVEAGFADYVTEALDVAASVELDKLPLGLSVPTPVLARLKSVKKETKPMSDPVPVQATLEQLEALHGADSNFVLAQLKAKATLTDAVNALNAKLTEELRAAREAKPAPPVEPVAPIVSGTITTSGVAPTVIAGVEPFANATQPIPTEKSGTVLDPVEEFKTRFNELRARGMSASDAARMVWRDNPSLRSAALGSYETKTGCTYA